jgi:hypothetical protein
MTTTPGQDGHDAVDRAEELDEPEGKEEPDAIEDPAVDPSDAGFPASPELAEGNHDFTDGDPGDEAGDVD